MDPSIRPIRSEPARPAKPITRRREGEAFQVPDREPEHERPDDDEPAETPHDERPVGPRPPDEAGSHLDLTA